MKTAASEEAELHAQIERARKKSKKLENSLQSAVTELDAELAVKERFTTLGEVCVLLERLDELGGSDLFLGDQAGSVHMPDYIAQLRERVNGYSGSLDVLQEKHDKIAAEIRSENNQISLAQEDILELQELEESRKNEFVIEREITELPYRATVMPWSKKGEDEKRLRKYVALAIIYSTLMFLLIPLINLPVPDIIEETKIPERLAKLLKKEEPKPELKPADKPQQKSTDKKQARKKAESSGLLAFKDNFTELMSIASEADLGAKANITNSGKQTNQAARNLVVSRSSAISGISSASLSRNTGGAGKGMKGGVQFSRVESSIGVGDGGGGRPTGSSSRPGRTDEEIQIVFDRYKAALYRIYQRELRIDPTLQGNMVLRITIAPDGAVTFCKVQSTDIKSSSMSGKIVGRVKRFNFGAKKGVPAMTILYPIDFLPTT